MVENFRTVWNTHTDRRPTEFFFHTNVLFQFFKAKELFEERLLYFFKKQNISDEVNPL